jgi:NAD-dependent SIR2 family protein deacetylase
MLVDARVAGPVAVVSFVREALLRAEKIVVVLGAGLSTAAGVPDFRSPGSGLYETLRRAGVGEPQEVFDARVFADEPEIFWSVAHLFYGATTQALSPTLAHRRLASLRILRCYTQNVDGLERAAGMANVVAAHGDATHVRCSRPKCASAAEAVTTPRIAAAVRARSVPLCLRPRCPGVMRPCVVFFGEPLAEGSSKTGPVDAETADAILVAGTSLRVAPLNALHRHARAGVPRIFINREPPPASIAAGEFDAILLGELDGIFDILFGEGEGGGGGIWEAEGPAARLISTAPSAPGPPPQSAVPVDLPAPGKKRRQRD